MPALTSNRHLWGSGEEKPLLGLIPFFSARFSEEICLGQVVWGSPGPSLGLSYLWDSRVLTPVCLEGAGIKHNVEEAWGGDCPCFCGTDPGSAYPQRAAMSCMVVPNTTSALGMADAWTGTGEGPSLLGINLAPLTRQLRICMGSGAVAGSSAPRARTRGQH